jgi:hypothetical protein
MCNLGRTLQKPLLVLSIFCLSTITAQAKYGGGSGTAEDPYLIETAEQMNAIGANLTDWDKSFKLIEDIDLSDLIGANFNIIGRWVAWGSSENRPFAGVFDGNGKTISNFSHTSTSGNGIGLFAHVRGRVQNLRLVNPKIISNGQNVGGLVGYLEDGRITNCNVKNADVSGGFYVGCLAGTNDGTITACGASGQVKGDTFVGGLAGLLGEGLVTTSYSTTAVSGNQDIGGLVGMTDNELSTISDSYAAGDVTGNMYVGGLIGQMNRGAATKCYSVGRVSGNQYLGGLVGYKRALAMTWNCFWDINASGQPTSAEGIGKTTIEMKTADTFSNSGWDFFTIWTICEGVNYPVLLWQIPVGDFKCPDGVDMIDFAWFAQKWKLNNCGQANNFCNGIDLDQSGSVDFYDLALFADHWLEGVPQQ